MTQQMKQSGNRSRLALIIAGAVLVVGLLGALVTVLVTLDRNGDDMTDGTNPRLVEGSGTGPISGPAEGVSAVAAGGSIGEEGAGRLNIRLSKGQPQPAAYEPLPLSTGEPLTAEEIEQILARLPELTAETQDQVDFRLPEESLPPPRTGETIDETFPPAPESGAAPVVPSGPLEVLRYAPEGEIPLAPFVNVTFNQPMVPLTSLEDLAAEDVPVQLEPAIPGTWKWLGTKTLSFEHDSTAIDRLPMATEYEVTIPAGTESESGGRLAETVSWTFSTPPPQMISAYPKNSPQPLEPLLFVAFDQRINPDAVLPTIQVSAGGQPVSIRLASEEEVNADEEASQLVERVAEGRWIAFRPTAPLPADTPISVDIGPGTPSAEGPLTTTQSQSFSFQTYAPLRIERAGCSWSPEDCPPLANWFIDFNNPLDTEAYDESMITIEPALPGATVNIFGDTIDIRGASEGRTTYRVTVDADIQDIFGQTLGRDETLTIRVGSAEPFLSGPDEALVTLDPTSDRPLFSVYAMNHNRLRVQAFDVEPSDWPAFRSYLQDYYRQDNPGPPPGQRVMDETMPLEAAADKLTEATIDLSDALDGDYGHLIVVVEPTQGLNRDNRYRNTVQAWVQLTQIGLDAFVDHSEMVVWASDLRDGAPLSGVTIEAAASGSLATTGSDGTSRFDLPGQGISYLVATSGSDIAMLPQSSFVWDDSKWQPRPVEDELRWYVFDDRGMYRPGEEVHVKGWLRHVGGDQNGDVGLVGANLSSIQFQVIGSQGNELDAGRAETNPLGGFDFAFTLPEQANLGYAHLRLNAEGDLSGLIGRDYYHEFQIQEFRRPEFEVTARNETAGPYFSGGQATLAAKATYFAGGPLPNAEVTWQVSSSPSSYAPPKWPDFTFGKWIPWWFGYDVAESFGPYPPGFEEFEVETFSGMTDASGEHYLQLDFDQSGEPQPYSILAEATVIDVNRQAWTAGTSLLVHPAELYVGLRSPKTFVERGEPLEIDLIVTDVDGDAVSGRPITVQAARLEWLYGTGGWDEQEVEVQECSLESAAEPVTCSFETGIGGRYRITATVSDAQGRTNLSQFVRWVSGGQQPPARQVEQEVVTLIPDKESYQPGDVAQILVQSPFGPAEGLLTVSRSGLLYSERFTMADGSHTLQVPIGDEHIPNLHIQVDLAGSAQRTNDQGEAMPDVPPRPAYASGGLNLSIPPLSRTLAVEVSPQDGQLEPGGETTIDVSVVDAAGQPVSDAEVALVVVDEAILALSNYQLEDPLGVFYRDRPSMLGSTYGRASIVLANPELLSEQTRSENVALMATATMDGMVLEGEVMEEAAMEAPAEAPMAAGVAADQDAAVPAIRVRTNFDPLAAFAPAVHTDSDGRAQVPVSLPDNLTRYRIMAVAVDDDKSFGTAEANLVARLPLMVRPSAPRFLNFGDRFELPVVLQNQTDDPMSVNVVVEAGNVELLESQGLRVDVPANDRVEVRFPAASVMPGTARLQVAAVSGDYADAATADLPVYTPATTEAFATYGVVDEGGVIQPVAAPGAVFPQFGGLEITTSSTALQALTDAVLYLVSYPYDCSEQLASRILAVAALRDVLTAFSAEGLPTPEEMEAAVQRDIEQLAGLQNADGGFPYWRRGWDSIPFNTVHVAHALHQARLKGFDVPLEMQQMVLEYLRQIEQHYPDYYNKKARQTTSAYALYVRHLMNDTDRDKARRLLNEAGLEELSLEAVAWIWQVLNDDPASTAELEAIRRHVENRAVETAGAANFTTDYGDQAYLLLHSDRRTDAVILDALIADDPESDLIPKVVNGLLAHRTRGRWNNTQENVFVLLALDRYFNTFESQEPDFVARLWLGDTYAGSHEFSGRTTERRETTIPMAYLVDEQLGGGDTQDLILSKEGPGRLYYRLGLRYAPDDLDLDPLNMGFVVQRSYEAVDDPEDVHQDEDGVWHVKAGARVRVRLSMVADNRRYHVALVDPLPAGLEIVNPALAVSGSIPQDPNAPDYRYGWWWWGTWYEHQNMRDERAEAFATLLWDGVYDYSYVTRATTPGHYVVPPAKAEEMYSPEVFGRSASDQLIVE